MKTKQIIFIICMAITPFYTVYPQFAGGTGTVNDPYQITTIVQLDSVRWHMSASFILMNDLDFGTADYNGSHKGNFDALRIDTVYYQGELSSWKITPFTGNFNGNNKKIKNIKIASYSLEKAGNSNAGLFANLSRGNVTNLTLEDCSIIGHWYVGGIAGEANFGKISGCKVTGNITGSNYVGGLVGFYYANDILNPTIMRNNQNEANITGNESVGGIVGGALIVNVSNCTNKGKITSGTTGIKADVNYNSKIGGIAGSCNQVDSCYNEGEIYAPFTLGVGGIAGSSTGSFNRNAGKVTGYQYVGGIAGKGGGIKVSCNSGEITGTINVGGISGFVDYHVYHSWEKPKLRITGCYNTGNVTGSYRVDGIVPTDNSSFNCYYIKNKVTMKAGKSYWEPMEMAQGITEEQMKLPAVAAAMNYALNGGSSGNYWKTIQNDFPAFNYDAKVGVAVYPFQLSFNPFGVPVLIDGIRSEYTSYASYQLPAGNHAIRIADVPGAETKNINITANDYANYFLVETGITVKDTIEAKTPTAFERKYKIFEIRTLPQLYLMRYYTGYSNEFRQMNDLTFTSIDQYSGMSENNFYPIRYFINTYNGNGYKIDGLKIKSDSIDYGNVALFGTVSSKSIRIDPGVFIKNVALVNCELKGTSMVGGLVGQLEGVSSAGYNSYYAASNISNCTVAGSINGNELVGGIAGYSSGGKINNCKNWTTVSGVNKTGGILGRGSVDPIGIYGDAEVENCTNYGTIRIAGSMGGGISGCVSGWVNNCNNYGNITLSNDTASNIGGIGGFGSGGTIKNSTNYADIMLNNSNPKANVGGILGRAEYLGYNGGYLVHSIHIRKSINKGNITVSAGNIGGIVGDVNEFVKDFCDQSINVGKITAGTGAAGGIAGRISGGTYLRNCYNRGDVSVKSGGAGGVFGYVTLSKNTPWHYIIPSSIYNTGNVSKTENSESLTGGLIGYFELYTDWSGTITPFVANVNNFNFLQEGTVNQSLLGISNINDNFAKTSEQLKTQVYIDSLNFKQDSVVWIQDANGIFNNGYPIFKWQPALNFQQNAYCYVSDNQIVGRINEVYNFNVQLVSNTTWTINLPAEDWITITVTNADDIALSGSPIIGQGAATIAISMAPNNTGANRTASMQIISTVGNQTIKLEQPGVGTGVNDIFGQSALTISPNPATEYFTVQGLEKETAVSIFDISGKIVVAKNLSPNEKISVTHLSKGVYLVKVNGKTGKLMVK